MRILLTNDDGIDAPGLLALYAAIADLGEVHVVAPARMQSATSHAVTFHKPLRTTRQPLQNNGKHGDAAVEAERDVMGIAVEGRPADCVKLALTGLVPQPIDLVISGMNAGANVGINVIYSGTVGAAREAAIQGLPALAISLHLGDKVNIPWQRAVRHARQAIDAVLRDPLPAATVININVPILDHDAQPRGIRMVPLSLSPNVDQYSDEQAHDGSRSFQISNSMMFREHEPGTDVEALYQRFITITPLRVDTTCHETLQHWRQASLA